MTTHLIIEITSIAMLLLLALPGTQLWWLTKNKGIAANTSALSKTDDDKVKPIGFYAQLSRLAAAIF